MEIGEEDVNKELEKLIKRIKEEIKVKTRRKKVGEKKWWRMQKEEKGNKKSIEKMEKEGDREEDIEKREKNTVNCVRKRGRKKTKDGRKKQRRRSHREGYGRL